MPATGGDDRNAGPQSIGSGRVAVADQCVENCIRQLQACQVLTRIGERSKDDALQIDARQLRMA